MIAAAINQWNPDNDEFGNWLYDASDFYAIYDKMMEITGDDHEIASGAASWCELASVGEIYEFREGEIEIKDIE